jgi:hypothetical protein
MAMLQCNLSGISLLDDPTVQDQLLDDPTVQDQGLITNTTLCAIECAPQTLTRVHIALCLDTIGHARAKVVLSFCLIVLKMGVC